MYGVFIKGFIVMATVKLQWSNLLKLTELEFKPDFPAQLVISDEVLQCISWLTGTTGFDRRLLRCTKQGALLVANAWCAMHEVDVDVMYPEAGTPKTADDIVANDGVLLVTSTQIVTFDIARVSGGDVETIHVPPGQFYWYPFSTYSVVATVVPAGSGTASYVVVTAYKQ